MKYPLVTPAFQESLMLRVFMTGNFLTSVAGGVSQFPLKRFVGFRALISKVKFLTRGKMQTLQEALSSTFRISPFLPDPALLISVEALPLISNLIRPEDCGSFLHPFGQLKAYTYVRCAESVRLGGFVPRTVGALPQSADSLSLYLVQRAKVVNESWEQAWQRSQQQDPGLL